MNVNVLPHHTACALYVDDTGPVKPVCKFKYRNQYLFFFVEAAGAAPENVTVYVEPNPKPMQLVIDAVARRRPLRGDRRYSAKILVPTHRYRLDHIGWTVFNGEIHIWFPILSL